jgi:dihydrolipoamide dehydrogenase
MAYDTQVAIIGAGPGGYVAAVRLAQLGQQVTLIEKEALGGTCLNWGCIPSKALIYAASLYEKFQKAGLMGITADNIRVDVPKLQAWKGDVVKKLTGGIGSLMKNHNVKVMMGEASFQDAHTLLIKTNKGTETLTAEKILIASGSVPVQVSGFEFDGQTIIESRDALELNEVPARFGVVGGGVIGLEIGIAYAKLGAEVTIIEMMDQLLPGIDGEIAQMLNRSLKKRGLKVLLSTKANPPQKNADGSVSLTLNTPKGDETLTVDKLLVSVGRRPHAKGLALENVGITVNERGFIPVDTQLRTRVPHIFAIGDVTSGPLLAHKASKEGLVAADVIAGGNDCLDYRALPAAVFTDPEIATVGLTEQEALDKGYEIRVGKFPFQASGRALSMNQTEGMAKVIADANTDELLGVHLIGPDVSELIAEAALAIEMGATSEDLALTIHTHPTLPETIMEAAEAVHGKAIHIFQKEKPLVPVK